MKFIKALIYQYYWFDWRKSKYPSHSFSKFFTCLILGNILFFILGTIAETYRLFYMYGWVSTPLVDFSLDPHLFVIILFSIAAAIFYPLYLREDKIYDIINNEEYDTDDYESLAIWLPLSLVVLFFLIGFMNGYENNEAYLKEEAEEELQRKSEIVVGPGAYDPYNTGANDLKDDEEIDNAEQ